MVPFRDAVIKRERGDPIDVLTKFGWTISGPCKDIPKAQVSTTKLLPYDYDICVAHLNSLVRRLKHKNQRVYKTIMYN